MVTAILVLQILMLLGLGIGFMFFKSYFPKYFAEKGKNLATKEDIEEITRKVESVKAEIEEDKLIFQKKYQLKYEACLDALSLIDAHFSHTFDNGGQKIIRQYATTEHARTTHNKLILSCENKDILKKYEEIMYGHANDGNETPPTDLLNDFRNLIRKDLSYGNDLELNREKAWFGKVGFEPPNEESA
ncbi:hypothetical protein K8T06_13695 [bacterium]|nr:hypothetical protein [bacterium]